MSRVPAWLYILFGVLAIVAGILGVSHAPTGVPTLFWAVVTILGAGSLLYAWNKRHQHSRRT
jgi:hypothetical protein